MAAFDVLLLVAAAVGIAAAARRWGLSAPLLLVVAGLLGSLLPALPAYVLDPDLVLLGILPPLLYAAALDASWVGLRAHVRPVALLSVGLVLFTAAAVGVVADLLVPGLGLAAAFALGAIVAPPDAVAATAVGRQVGLPRRLLTVLGGESLLNDATALTAYRVALGAVASASFSLVDAAAEFVLAALGGTAVGLVLAVAAHEVLRRLGDPLVENAATLLLPFAAFLAAEQAHLSGVLAVVVAGLYIGHRAPRTLSYATRLQATAVWRVVGFLLESVVFLLIGLQLRTVLAALQEYGVGELAGYALAVNATVLLARVVWVFPAMYLPGFVSRRVRERDPAPPWAWVAVLSWAGMRGVVSLAAAYALPAGLPARDLVLFLTFTVVTLTLLLHGATLASVIRWLGVATDETMADRLAEAQATHSAHRAAQRRLDEVLRGSGADVPADVVTRLRELAELRSHTAWERLGRADLETPSAAYRRLRREMLHAEREEYVRLRDERRLDDEVLRRVQHDLDLEEAMLARD